MKSAVEDDIVLRSFPKIKPEDGVCSYLTSKSIGEQTKKYPEWDKSKASVEMELYLAKLELHLSQKRLAATRKRSHAKRNFFDKQLTELERKQKELQQTFQKMNEFVKTNQDKKERAQLKLAHEIDLQAKRTDDIQTIKFEIKYLAGVKTDMEDKTKEYRVYEDYLHNIVKISSGQFKVPQDIIARYVALHVTKDELAGKLGDKLDEYERAKTDMEKLIGENSLKLMGLYNQVRDLAARFEKAEVNALMWEGEVEKIHSVSQEIIHEHITVRNSCRNIYKSISDVSPLVVDFDEVPIEKQLLLIKDKLGELKQLVRKCDETT